MRDAQLFVDLGCMLNREELDLMPLPLIQAILLYKEIRHIAEYGGELRL